MELYTILYKILLFMKLNLPSSFILRYVRAGMNVHAFINELDPRKMKKFENLCTKSMESCPLCDTTYSGRVTSREGDIHNFA